MTDKKRILLVIDLLNAGGAQRQLVGLAKLLKEAGHTPKVVYYIEHPFYKQFLDDIGVQSELLMPLAKTEDKRGLSFYMQVKKRLRSVIKTFKPDTIIAYLELPCILTVLAKPKRMKCRVIVSERSTTQHINFIERVKFYCYRKADVIVPNSHSQERFISSHYPKLSMKVVTITNFVNTDVFKPTSKPIVNNIPVILTVGRLTPEKNILTYFRVLMRLKNDGIAFRALWYGGMYNSYSDQCVEAVKTMGLEDVFEFKQPIRDIVSAYQTADMLCLPSLYEGFPNVICEAMSCGLPVVASDVCDNPDIVSSECGLLFNPREEEDMYNKLEAMFTKPREEILVMKEASRQRAITMFSAERFLEEYEKIL